MTWLPSSLRRAYRRYRGYVGRCPGCSSRRLRMYAGLDENVECLRCGLRLWWCGPYRGVVPTRPYWDHNGLSELDHEFGTCPIHPTEEGPPRFGVVERPHVHSFIDMELGDEWATERTCSGCDYYEFMGWTETRR